MAVWFLYILHYGGSNSCVVYTGCYFIPSKNNYGPKSNLKLSNVNKNNLIKDKGDKMLKRYLVTITIVTIFLCTFMITYAQEKKEEVEDLNVQSEDVEKYMEVIASDSAMRIEMMNLIIEKCQGNDEALLGVGKTIIRNPEMHNMMKKMLKNDENIKVRTKTDGISEENEIMESTKKITKPKYDSNKK